MELDVVVKQAVSELISAKMRQDLASRRLMEAGRDVASAKKTLTAAMATVGGVYDGPTRFTVTRCDGRVFFVSLDVDGDSDHVTTQIDGNVRL